MNTKFCLLLLLVVCIAGFVAAKPQENSDICEENEEYTTCGSACAPTCDTMNTDIFCIQECIVGCQCIPGYVRNDEGRCVLPQEC